MLLKKNTRRTDIETVEFDGEGILAAPAASLSVVRLHCFLSAWRQRFILLARCVQFGLQMFGSLLVFSYQLDCYNVCVDAGGKRCQPRCVD